MTRATTASRLAAGFAVLSGLGFGLPAVYGAVHLARQGTVWQFMGFPTYGQGPFEKAGIPTTVPLIAGFAAVCGAEVIAAACSGVGVAQGRGWRSPCSRSRSRTGSDSHCLWDLCSVWDAPSR